jgi:tRNA-dihydrouridine synthase A
VSEAGSTVFIVHARNAWLKGLSPKENREVPPLRYGFVTRLKLDFPALVFIVNGGVTTSAQIGEHLGGVDGVMMGREAYHHPWSMASWDTTWLGAVVAEPLTREAVEDAMVAYMTREAAARATPWSNIARHMMGLYNGVPGARRWRQVWSDHRLKALPPHAVQARATQARQAALRESETA